MKRIQDFDLNLLVVFHTLMNSSSITVAAKELHLTQPAVSNALRRLRDAFQDDLFVRAKQGIQPTPLAQSLAADVALVVGNIKDRILSSPGNFDPKLSDRRFRIATTDYGALLLLPKLSEALANLGARIAIDVVSMGDRIPYADFESGNADLALGKFKNAPPSLLHRKLFNETFVGIGPKGLLTKGERMSLDRYTSLPHVFVAPWGQLGGDVDDYLSTKSRTRKVSFMVPSFALAPEVIARTNSICTLPKKVVDHFVELYDLDDFELPFKLADFSIGLLWHPRTTKDAGWKWLRELIASLRF